MNDSAVLLSGETRCWSLLGFKGLTSTEIIMSFLFHHLYKTSLSPLHFHFIVQHSPFLCLTTSRGLVQSFGLGGIPGHFFTVAMPSLHVTTPPQSSPLHCSLFFSVRFPYSQWNTEKYR